MRASQANTDDCQCTASGSDRCGSCGRAMQRTGDPVEVGRREPYTKADRGSRNRTSAGILAAAVLLSLHSLSQASSHPSPTETHAVFGRVNWFLEHDHPAPPKPLCLARPEDLSRDIRGTIQFGPPPKGGEPFPESVMEDFPYASKNHCHEHTEALHLISDDCELTPLDPLALLEHIRGRRLIFWGDSVMRQFMAYLVLRLKRHETRKGFDLAGNYQDHPEADPKRCHYSREFNTNGLELDTACFSLKSNAFEEQQSCFWYLDGTTALCYVKVTTAVVDNKNVVFWNELTENDIMLLNVGLHHNRKNDLKHSLIAFTHLAAFTAKRRPLPLMIWRESSAQHFRGGDGGNYLMQLSSELRNVNPSTFRCTKYPFQIMKDANWRNRFVNEMGFVGEHIRMDFPTLKVWNTTAMAYWLHPRTHGTRTDHAVADCSHFCPNYGGMFEVWSTLLQNFLAAAQPLRDTLTPRITTTALDLKQYSKFMKSKEKEMRELLLQHRAEILGASGALHGREMMDASQDSWWASDQL